MQTTNVLYIRIDSQAAATVRATAPRKPTTRWLVAALGIIVSVLPAGGLAHAQRAATEKSVSANLAVRQYFASLSDYKPGDLVTRSQVADALAKAADAGANVPADEQILAATLPDNSFLARELSTPAGKKFMRKVARHPGAFSRLDRLSSIARGQSLVRDLVRGADGDKFIEYLATTRGGRKLGKTLAGSRQGTDLNQPTGRIYTAEDLMAALDQMSVASGQTR